MESSEALSNLQRYSQMALDAIVIFLPNILIAIGILIIGFWLIKKVNRIAAIALARTGIAQEITSFFSSFLDIGMKIVVLLVAAGRLGFDATSLVAVIAAAGFAVGLALQGFLGNFASGMTIVFFRPYKVGDWVQVADQFGKVENIQIFNTTLTTPGQKTLIVPNGQVTDNVITNFSSKGAIKLELNVTMPYAESFPRVKKIILKALKEVHSIHQEPVPDIGIESYDSHSIILAIRPFINPDDYWKATFEVNEHIKNAFNENGIQVAYSEGVELGPIGN